MIGTQLETAGWRQGSIIKGEDAANFLSEEDFEGIDNVILVIASQSCDIANNNISADPYVEVSVARKIEKIDGNLSFNKNPRQLHMNLLIETGDTEVYKEQAIEFKAYEKIRIPKEQLVGLQPDTTRDIEAKQLDSYISWLASRYSRPALPTEFNNRIAAVDPKDKRKKKAKSANQNLSGIYVEIIPDQEISADENYRVNLLGLVPTDFTGNLQSAQNALDGYAEILKSAGMDVTSIVKKEDEISVAVIKRFKRFYYDDLSIRDDAPLPPETKVTM